MAEPGELPAWPAAGFFSGRPQQQTRQTVTVPRAGPAAFLSGGLRPGGAGGSAPQGDRHRIFAPFVPSYVCDVAAS